MVDAFVQVFTNADKAHVEKVLGKLGLEDCFEGVICFETLNPPLKPVDHHDEKDITVPSTVVRSVGEIGDGSFSETNSETDTINNADPSNANTDMPILCKPSLEAIKAAIKIADINPGKTVSKLESNILCLILRCIRTDRDRKFPSLRSFLKTAPET